MKHTFKVGDKVRVLASARLAPEHHNKKAVVVAVEPEDYTGNLTIEVQIKGVGWTTWLQLDELTRHEKKPLKVWDRVVAKIVLGNGNIPEGTEGIVCDVDRWDAELPYEVEFPIRTWWCSLDQLKRVKAKEAPAEAATEAAPTTEAPAWPWPAGTKVRFRADGGYSQLASGRVHSLNLGKVDWPTVNGNYVQEHDVERAE